MRQEPGPYVLRPLQQVPDLPQFSDQEPCRLRTLVEDAWVDVQGAVQGVTYVPRNDPDRRDLSEVLSELYVLLEDAVDECRAGTVGPALVELAAGGAAEDVSVAWWLLHQIPETDRPGTLPVYVARIWVKLLAVTEQHGETRAG